MDRNGLRREPSGDAPVRQRIYCGNGCPMLQTCERCSKRKPMAAKFCPRCGLAIGDQATAHPTQRVSPRQMDPSTGGRTAWGSKVWAALAVAIAAGVGGFAMSSYRHQATVHEPPTPTDMHSHDAYDTPVRRTPAMPAVPPQVEQPRFEIPRIEPLPRPTPPPRPTAPGSMAPIPGQFRPIPPRDVSPEPFRMPATRTAD